MQLWKTESETNGQQFSFKNNYSADVTIFSPGDNASPQKLEEGVNGGPRHNPGVYIMP